MIPKILHLCWLSGDAYPSKIQRCIDSWKKVLPDYEIMLWDTNRFPLEQSLWVKQAFECKKYAFAADYIRFYALFHYGGIYLDSDVEVLKRFDDFLDLPYFIGQEKAGTMEAAIVGAEKGNRWIKHCLDYYQDRAFLKEDGSMDIRKLPEIMNDEIAKILPINNITTEQLPELRKMDFQNQVVVLPSEFFSPKVFDSREVIITPNTYAIHHYQNSWFSHKAKTYYRTRTVLIRVIGYKATVWLERHLFPGRFKN